MPETLAFLRDFDLSAHLRYYWDLVETMDPCFGGLIVLVLMALGHKLASRQKALYALGLRLAALTFLLHSGWSLLRNGGWQTVPLATQASRSGLIAGSVLAVIWITLPAAWFVYRYFRVALAGFLVYVGYALVTAETFDADILPGVALRGLLVAVLTMAVAWILQPAWDMLVTRLRPTPALPVVEERNSSDSDGRLIRKELRRWRQLFQSLMRPATTLWTGTSEPLVLASEARRRRDRARRTAELTYVLSMPEIATHFPRDMFENWVNRYLGDHLPADEVEENSQHLQMILTRQQKRQQNPASAMTLEDLHAWYSEEQKRIRDLPLDEATRQAKLLDLQEHFLSMSQRVLGEPNAVVPMVLPSKKITMLADMDQAQAE